MKENELSENIETAINTQKPVWLGVWGPKGLDVWLTVGQKPEQQPEVCKANQQCLSGLPCVCQPKEFCEKRFLKPSMFLRFVEQEERNFCPRCGKRTADPTTIHTCTPPEKT